MLKKIKIAKPWKCWWFYPVVVAYLLFGVWFSGLNQRVYNGPELHRYSTRLILFPVSTARREGWGCFKTWVPRGAHCVLKPGQESFTNYFSQATLVNEVSKDFPRFHGRAVYRTLLALFWPLKVLFNFVALACLYLGIFLTVTVVVISCIVVFILSGALNLIITLILWIALVLS